MNKLIDWEAAKSGKRPLRMECGFEARYVGLCSDPNAPHVVEHTDDGVVYLGRYANDGRPWLADTRSYDLIQEEEVIEREQWVTIDAHEMIDQVFAFAARAEKCMDNPVKVTVRRQGDKITITGGTDDRNV